MAENRENRPPRPNFPGNWLRKPISRGAPVQYPGRSASASKSPGNSPGNSQLPGQFPTSREITRAVGIGIRFPGEFSGQSAASDSGSSPLGLIPIMPAISARRRLAGGPRPHVVATGQDRGHSGFPAGGHRHFRPQRALGAPRYQNSPDCARRFSPPELERPDFQNHGPSPPRHATPLSGHNRCAGPYLLRHFTHPTE